MRVATSAHLSICIEPVVPDMPWYPHTDEKWAQRVGTGSQQSPIESVMCEQADDRTATTISWRSQAVELTCNSHTVQLIAKGAQSGKMKVEGHTCTLVQCHFHWAPEHTVGGKQYPFESHCVYVFGHQ